MPDKDVSIQLHKRLHESLDELVACWLSQGFHDYTNVRLPSSITLMDFMKWSHQQTIDPECSHEIKEGEKEFKKHARTQDFSQGEK
jgi:hypothetical protein